MCQNFSFRPSLNESFIIWFKGTYWGDETEGGWKKKKEVINAAEINTPLLFFFYMSWEKYELHYSDAIKKKN